MPAQPKRDSVLYLVKQIAGQANVLTIPRYFIDLSGGDHLAALFLSQCLYWSDRTKNPEGWIRKSDSEWLEELCLTRKQTKRIIEALAPIIETEKFRWKNSMTLHYRVNMQALTDAIEKQAAAVDPQTPPDQLSQRDTCLNDQLSQRDTCPPNQLDQRDSSINIDYNTKTTLRPNQLGASDSKFAGLMGGGEGAKPPELLGWLRREYCPLAEAFLNAAGSAYTPIDSEKGLWQKTVREWVKLQLAPEHIAKAVQRMRHDSLTISGPQSVTKVARDVKATQTTSQETYPVFHAGGQNGH